MLIFFSLSRHNVTVDGVYLRQRGISRSLDRCFVAVDGICCEMLAGGTAEVQVRNTCSPYTITSNYRYCDRNYNYN